MIKEELLTLIDEIKREGCEGQRIELKSAHGGCPKIYDTLSSFSNQNNGGIIIFGVSETDNYVVVGVYDPQDLLHKISEQCKQMQPEVRGETTTCEINGKVIIALEVPSVEVFERPVYYKGAGVLRGSYVRVGEADEQMSEYEVYSYEAFKKHTKDDMRIFDGADIQYLDKHAVDMYLTKLKMEKPNTQNMSDEDILRLMGIIKEGKPTLTALLCFSKYPQAIYPQLCVTAVVVPGEKMGDVTLEGQRFIDNKKIEGTIPQMIEGVMHFVAKNMTNGIRFDEYGKRIEMPEYPLTAVREAIINALVHRDYSMYTEGMPVRLEMYKDRLEIVNAGGLYGAIDIDELGRIHADVRNKGLVSTLETIQVIENRYSGIPTIRREMKEAGLPEPGFIDRKGLFKVILYNGKDASGGVVKDKKDLVTFCKMPRTRKEIADYLGMTQYYAMKKYVEPLVESGKLAYTIPNKVKSKDQKIYSL